MSTAAAMIWRAFADLSTCRSVGFGPGPIPWMAIDAYAERHGLSGRDEVSAFDFDLFSRLLRGLDAEWLDTLPKPG